MTIKSLVVVVLLSSICLSGCTKQVVLYDTLVIPALDKRLTEECHSLPFVTSRSKAALVSADVEASLDYAACKKKHSAMVEIYQSARQHQLDQISKIKSKNK